jgi:hypothetical protein
MCSSSEEKGSGEQIDASAFIYACSELVLWQKKRRRDGTSGTGTQLRLDVIDLLGCLLALMNVPGGVPCGRNSDRDEQEVAGLEGKQCTTNSSV